MIKTELNSLSQIKDKVIETRTSPHVWPEYFLSHSIIESFLVWVVPVIKWHNLPELTTSIHHIINPIDLDFMKSDKKHIIQRIICNTESVTTDIPLSFKNILEYFAIVKDVFSLLLHNKNPKKSLINKSNAISFMYIEELTNYYITYMKKVKQTHDMLLLETLLISLGYNPEKNKFEATYIEDIEYFSKHAHLDGFVDEYFKISKKYTTKLEAFIIRTGITLVLNHPRRPEIKGSINHHITYFKEQLGEQLSSQIYNMLESSCISGTYDLENILERLTGVNNLEEMDMSTDDSHNTACSTVAISDITDRHAYDNLQNMLNYFNIMQNYHQKFTFKDALVIRHEIPKSKIKPSDLPIITMNKIMACDKKCRSIIIPCRIPKNEYHIYENEESGDNNNNDDRDSNSEPDEDNISKDKYCIIHPSDIIMILLHCSDNLLRHELFSKLFSCQLAVPLLLPDPIKNSVTLLLWALRSVKKSWKAKGNDGKIHHKNCRIVDHEGAIVSFLKCGNLLSKSKSELLNKVVGSEDIFFHWDLLKEPQNCWKIISQGVVELCCYYPGKKDAIFEDAVIFTNLHGDAVRYPKQVAFIQAISCLSCILIKKKDLIKKEHINILKTLANSPGGIIILLTDSRSYNEDKITSIINSENFCVICLKEKTSAAIQNELRILISSRIKRTSQWFVSIANCADIAHKHGINVDEDDKDCGMGKTAALNVRKEIDAVGFNEIKDHFLPLQGPDMWQKWAAHEKELHRHKERKNLSLMEYKVKIEQEKDKTRFKQLQYIDNTYIPYLINVFVQNMLWGNKNSQCYFYQWLKMDLDDLSKDKLQELQTKYQNIKLEIEKVSNIDSGRIKELKDTNNMLINASVGIEHFFREIGQIYETVVFKDIHKPTEMVGNFHRNALHKLPMIAAKILMEGFAMEIMDGEASHIPLTWVKAVIRCLKQMHTNKTLFILSILGVQSSGKSTLLNTMFGLRFNVSVARCTRGAFIQLLSLDENLRNELHCDFILIVDTEGICAPELLGDNSQEHDNELATFVIGLADLTVINIYGETPANLTDILQTVLHAFIRMKEVEKNPGCLFVHQNVTEQFSTESLQPGKQILLNELNRLTQAVAKIEHCEANYLKFQDVIKLDVSKDVFYFSSLWKGDPPMAPINIGYSECAQDLKQEILKLIKNHQKFCTFEAFEKRIQDLWTAVLKENFVFSFKNTMEVVAYGELDLQYGEWCWKLQEVLQNQLFSCENRIKSCSKQDAIENIKNTCINDSIRSLNIKCNECHNELNSYIEKHEYAKIMAKWNFDYRQKLIEKKDMFTTTIKEHCIRLFFKKENDRKNEEMQQQYEERLREEITELVAELGPHKTADSGSVEISKMFDANWSKWISEFRKTVTYLNYASDQVIDRYIESSLGNNFQSEYSSLMEKLEQQPLNKTEGSLLFMPVNGKHIIDVKTRTKPSWYNQISTWVGFGNSKYFPIAQEETHNILRSIDRLIKSITETKKEGVTPDMPDWLLKELLKNITNFNISSESFSFTSEYKLDMALVVCGYASKEFKQWTSKLKEQNDPILPLQKQKTKFLTIFTNKYLKVATEIAAANELCNSLIESIVNATVNKLHVSLVSHLKTINGNFNSKPGLKVQVLTDLAKQENFAAYKVYLVNSTTSYQQWTEKYISGLCNSEDDTEKSSFEELAIQEMNQLLYTVTKAVETTDISIVSSTEWLDSFCSAIDGVIEIKKFDWIEDVKNVSSNLDSISNFKNNLIKELKSKHSSETMFEKIHNKRSAICKRAASLLYDSVINTKCTTQCPFCSEQCDIINSDHLQHDPPKLHHVQVHRPQCVNRGTWYETNKLVLDVCNNLVDSKSCYLVLLNKDPTGNTRIPYKDYQKEHPEWDIPGESISDPPMYWMWFVAYFYKDLVTWSKAVETDIPETWKTITKSKAIDSLAQTYGLYYSKDTSAN